MGGDTEARRVKTGLHCTLRAMLSCLLASWSRVLVAVTCACACVYGTVCVRCVARRARAVLKRAASRRHRRQPPSPSPQPTVAVATGPSDRRQPQWFRPSLITLSVSLLPSARCVCHIARTGSSAKNSCTLVRQPAFNVSFYSHGNGPNDAKPHGPHRRSPSLLSSCASCASNQSDSWSPLSLFWGLQTCVRDGKEELQHCGG